MGTDLLLSLQALAKEVLHQLAQGREGGFTHRPLPSESLEPEPTAHCPGPTTPARPSHTSRYAGYCGAPDRPPGKGFWRSVALGPGDTSPADTRRRRCGADRASGDEAALLASPIDDAARRTSGRRAHTPAVWPAG